MTELGAWLLGLAAPLLAVVVASWAGLELERLRRFAVGSAVVLVVIAAQAMLIPGLGQAAIAWPGGGGALWGPSVVRTDVLANLLIPMVAALWLLTIAVTPRSRLDRAGIRRTAIATAITTLAFATESPLVLALVWTGSTAAYLFALARPDHRRARRVAAIYLGGSTALFVAGVALGTDGGVGLILVTIAALIRKGIFPFHAWVPEVFERGPLGPAVLFTAPQLGSYATAILIVPDAGPEVLRVVAILALITAVYGAALTLIQRDVRRGLGYLFVSQSALVMAGLDCTSEVALAGSLVLWVSSALAFAGIGRAVLVLEARRGRLDLSRHHGGYERMPMLALSFLVLGLACTGFPGTLGFIGEELLVDGATAAFPVLGFCVVVAGALTGLAVLRMYFSLFCGRREAGPGLELRRSERLVFGALAIALIAAGLGPGPLVRSRFAAAARILDRRELESGPGAELVEPAIGARDRGREPEPAQQPEPL